jgi:uncharacterized protein
MPRQVEVYLDIETTWSGRPTVVGFRSSVTGTIQLVGDEITRRRLSSVLPRTGVMYTFNGHCFDLPKIRQHLGLDLRERFSSYDLRFTCKGAGLTGGQKYIEQCIGFSRRLPDVNGKEAITLWNRYTRHDDASALRTLLRYNAEDLAGMVAIKRHVTRGASITS